MNLKQVLEAAEPIADKHPKARIETELTRRRRARRLFVHWARDNFNFEDIASTLNISREAIYYHLHRGLDKEEKKLLIELNATADPVKVWWEENRNGEST